MHWFRATIRPEGAFGTVIRGDTLFGQLCWALRHRLGEAALNQLLDGYVAGRPFLVVSDAFPADYLPRPELPPRPDSDPTKRKEERKRRFIPISAYMQPVDTAVDCASAPPGFRTVLQPHNSISRRTFTTSRGFDPYQTEQLWPAKGLRLDVHLVADLDRLQPETLTTVLKDIGQFGYGRDASIGLGRFGLDDWREGRPAAAAVADAWLALAPIAPQGGSWDCARCYYRPFTRFGRHGADAASGGAVFKAPVLLADTGAVLTPKGGPGEALFAGRGLGGDGRLSAQEPRTVHQGYAPVLPIALGMMA